CHGGHEEREGDPEAQGGGAAAAHVEGGAAGGGVGLLRCLALGGVGRGAGVGGLRVGARGVLRVGEVLGAAGVLGGVHDAHSSPAASTAAATIAGSVQVSGAPYSIGAPCQQRTVRCRAQTGTLCDWSRKSVE